MSNIRELALQTAKARSNGASKKHLPDRVWNAFVWKNWKGYSRWEKSQIIQQGYERNAPFYAAANIIAQTTSEIPIYVEYESKGRKFTTDTHPILDVLERNDSREELIEKLTLYLCVTGEAYGKKVFASAPGRKRPLGLIVLPSQYVTPVQGDEFSPIQYYEVFNRQKVDLLPEEVIYIYKPDLSNPFKGMSPGIPLAELIDLHNAGVTWNKNIALEGGVPPIVARAPGGMSEEEGLEVIEKFSRQGGARRSNKLKLLSEELKLEDLGTDPHDAEWKEAVLMSMRMIFMSFGVSSSLMNDAANKTYNNVKDSRKALYLDSCLPIGDKLYKKISLDLRKYYSDNPTIKTDRAAIEPLQEDAKAQAERLSELRLAGIISANEARSVLKWPKSTEANADLLETSKAPSPVKPPADPVNVNEQ